MPKRWPGLAYPFLVIDGDNSNYGVLSGPWPHQEPEYADAKSSLHSSLRSVREAMLSKLEGLSDYDIRRPLSPTGTNLLGLIKHLSIVEARYFGETFGRPITRICPSTTRPGGRNTARGSSRPRGQPSRISPETALFSDRTGAGGWSRVPP